MDIEKLVRQEAPNESRTAEIHDKAYAKALRISYELWKDYSWPDLITAQKETRCRYTGTHQSVADCVVLFQLIKNFTTSPT